MRCFKQVALSSSRATFPHEGGVTGPFGSQKRHPKNLEPWNSGTLELLGTWNLEPWNPGTLEPWNLKPWSLEP